ncbi:hypothetical protein [Zavarzinia sp. CC-PAN008]|uniref:hypothetical protein n=1 Tax=Zavarzinia sp. CC-PAN008 TaxID=3243332 RepID=UPI003F7457CC
MRSLGKLMLGLTLGLVAQASAAQADSLQDFTVRNNGNTYVHYIYVSPITTSEWEDDVLGNDVLGPGSSITIRMNGYRSDQCLFDIKVVDENQGEREYRKVNLCKVAFIDYP